MSPIGVVQKHNITAQKHHHSPIQDAAETLNDSLPPKKNAKWK
jgi:hypothetical protein